MPRRRDRSIFQRFIESEASGGLVLMASATLGMPIANSPLADDYAHILHWSWLIACCGYRGSYLDQAARKIVLASHA